MLSFSAEVFALLFLALKKNNKNTIVKKGYFYFFAKHAHTYLNPYSDWMFSME